LAAGEGRLEIVRLLCEAGADVNVKDRWGGRPLDDAKRNRHDDVVEYLESLGGKTGDPHETEDGDATKNLEEEDDNMRVEFSELEMIERIGECLVRLYRIYFAAHDASMNSRAFKHS
jgi:ankyrin repeat protein